MKVGDKVDVISASVSGTWNKAELWFSHGWEIDTIHGGWYLVKQETEFGPKYQKVQPWRLRKAQPPPPDHPSGDRRMPPPGTLIKFRPQGNKYNEWGVGPVLKTNKKSVKVYWDGKFFNRTFDQFIEVTEA
mgnify:CR=1 FL=1